MSIAVRTSAVLRNKIKRQIRECFRFYGEQLAQSYDFHVVLPRSYKVDYCSPGNIFSALEGALKNGLLTQ